MSETQEDLQALAQRLRRGCTPDWTTAEAMRDAADALERLSAERPAPALAQVTQERDEAQQQVEVLRPGGTYAWKSRAEAAESALTAQREELERLRASVCEMVDAMRAYEMEVEEPAPYRHREMMERAEALIACTPTKSAP